MAHRFAEWATSSTRAPSQRCDQVDEQVGRPVDDVAVGLPIREGDLDVAAPRERRRWAAVEVAVPALAQPRVAVNGRSDPAKATSTVSTARARSDDEHGGQPVVTASTAPAPRPAPARPGTAVPGSQPVAIPASLSVVVAWVSYTRRTVTGPVYQTAP